MWQYRAQMWINNDWNQIANRPEYVDRLSTYQGSYPICHCASRTNAGSNIGSIAAGFIFYRKYDIDRDESSSSWIKPLHNRCTHFPEIQICWHPLQTRVRARQETASFDRFPNLGLQPNCHLIGYLISVKAIPKVLYSPIYRDGELSIYYPISYVRPWDFGIESGRKIATLPLWNALPVLIYVID